MKCHAPDDTLARRRAEYPPIGDQLDAFWKALAAMQEQAWPTEVVAIMSKVAEVKTKYPKKAK